MKLEEEREEGEEEREKGKKGEGSRGGGERGKSLLAALNWLKEDTKLNNCGSVIRKQNANFIKYFNDKLTKH